MKLLLRLNVETLERCTEMITKYFIFVLLIITLVLTRASSIYHTSKEEVKIIKEEPTSLMSLIQNILKDPEFLTLSLEHQLRIIQAIYSMLLKKYERNLMKK